MAKKAMMGSKGGGTKKPGKMANSSAATASHKVSKMTEMGRMNRKAGNSGSSGKTRAPQV